MPIESGKYDINGCLINGHNEEYFKNASFPYKGKFMVSESKEEYKYYTLKVSLK